MDAHLPTVSILLLWIALTPALLEAAPTDSQITTVEKLQNTIKAMESLLEKQQQRMMSGFDGMRRRVYTLEKIADKTRKEFKQISTISELCPILPAPVNGRVLGGQTKTGGDRAYIICNTGFELRGEEERICLDNGTWSGKPAQCIGQILEPEAITDTTTTSMCQVIDGGKRACSCPRGYQLSADPSTCIDVDECALGAMGGTAVFWDTKCQYKCNNIPGSYQCVCPPGYSTSTQNLCQDNDECALGTHNCNSTTDCFNTRGGFECVPTKCPPQYERTAKRTCERMPCNRGDRGCHNQPYTIAYHYMALASKVGVPARIFQLTADSDNVLNARFSLSGSDSIYFATRRMDRRSGWLILHREPVGPKVLRVDFQAREHRHDGRLFALHVARVTIFISEYSY